MSVTVSYSITPAETYLDLIQGPGGTEIDLVSMANGGIAGTSTSGGATDLDILTAAGGNAGGALNFSGTRSAVDQMANGDLVVVWQAADGASRFETRDSVTGASKSDGFFALTSSDPDVANLENGKNLFVCADNGAISILIPQNPGVYTFFKASSGAADERPSVAALDGGGFVVAWSATRNFATEVWYAVYENTGAMRLAPTLLETTDAVFHDISATGMADGGFAIAYEDTADVGANTDIRLTTFSSLGTVADRVAISDPDSKLTSYNDVRPYLTRMDNGLLAVSYTSDYVGQISTAIGPPPIPTGYEDDDTFVRIYDPVNGVLSGAAEVDAGQNPRLNVRDSAVAELGDGRLAVFHTNVSSSDAQGEVLDIVRRSVGDGANDVIMGERLVDLMQGGGGHDTYIIDGSNDVVDESVAGSNGTDTVRSSVISINLNYASKFKGAIEQAALDGSASLNLTGNGLDNRLVGNSGVNIIDGGAGNDTLDGKAGGDSMKGFTGNDTYYVDSSSDIVDESVAGSNGSDLVRSSTISINLGLSGAFRGTVESAVLEGSANLNLTGSTISNYLQGNNGNNILNGGGASDTLVGLGGNDIFRFANSLGSTNIDKITDYNVAQDRIELDNAYFTALVDGFLYASAFTANTTGLAGDASDRIIYETDTGKLFYDSNGSAAGGTYQQFATLSAGLSMSAGEFLVI